MALKDVDSPMLAARRDILMGMGASLLAVAAPAAAAQASLRPPFTVPTARKKASAPKSLPATEPVSGLSNESRYRKDDPTRSIVDPDLSDAYERSVAPLRVFAKAVVRSANRYVDSQGHDLEAAAQVGGLIGKWANADALKDVSNETGYFSRLIMTGPAALALLQVQDALGGSVCATACNWLDAQASSTLQFYAVQQSQTARNNHRYWAGLAVLSAGIAVNRRDYFDWGVQAARIGIDQVTADGALPLELLRGQRALSYHTYSVGPLVMIAEAAARNGNMALYSANSEALHRLVDFTLAQIDNPALIASLAGADQEALGSDGASVDPNDIAWLEIYESRFPGRSRWSTRLGKMRPLAASGLGGNLTLLFAKKTRAVAKAPKRKARS